MCAPCAVFAAPDRRIRLTWCRWVPASRLAMAGRGNQAPRGGSAASGPVRKVL